jgi:hypothetical protein
VVISLNRKVSKRLWIHIVFKNYGKRAFYIPIFLIGLPLTWAIMLSFGTMAGFVGAIFGGIWGLLIARLLAPKIGDWFGGSIYYPKIHLKTAPHIMSPLKGLIAREQYDEAIAELNELLEKKPFSPEPYLILVEVYANNLDDYYHAMELIENYFNQEKVYVFEENIEMILLYADLCQEHNYLTKAQLILEQEVKRKGYSALKRKRLQTRLEAISS